MGHLEISDEKGNRTTVPKDIMGNVNIRDDKGNNTTVSKDWT